MTNYYPALTGIRAVAAWMVFVHHFIPFPAATQPFLYNLAFEFHIGVSIFFVLSGFLIFHRYHSLKNDKNWLRKYFQNRIARIFPLLFILTAATYVFSGPEVARGLAMLPAFLLNVTLLNGYSDTLKFTGIAQAWTLTVEETFYLLAPLIMMISSKIKLLVVPAVALLIGFLLVFLSRNSQYFFGDDHFMLTYTFFGRCTEFIAGMFLGMIVKNKQHFRPGTYTFAGMFLVVVVMVVMAMLHSSDRSLLTYPEIALNNLILPLCIATFFYGLLREKTWISAILSARPFQVLGKSSYAFYLIHIGIIQQFLSTEITENPIFLFILLNMVAVVLFYGLERPLQDLIRAKK